jgi:hypothetical protein
LTNPEDKISIQAKNDEEIIINEKIAEMQNHFQKREEELIQHIETLERKLSQTSYSQVNQFNTISEQQSVYTPEKSQKQGFSIEEVIRSHPPPTESPQLASLKSYISFLKSLLLRVLSSATLEPSTEAHLRTLLREYSPSPSSTPKSRSSSCERMIEKSNFEIIQKLHHIEELNTVEGKYTKDRLLTRELVEGVFRKSSEGGEAMVEVLKDAMEEELDWFSGVFGKDFIKVGYSITFRGLKEWWR